MISATILKKNGVVKRMNKVKKMDTASGKNYYEIIYFYEQRKDLYIYYLIKIFYSEMSSNQPMANIKILNEYDVIPHTYSTNNHAAILTKKQKNRIDYIYMNFKNRKVEAYRALRDEGFLDYKNLNWYLIGRREY